MSHLTISASQLPPLLDQNAKVIDVRTPGEFKSVHVKGAELLPLNDLDPASFCKTNRVDEPVYILCKSGKRAALAAEKLESAGHRQAIVVEGGTDAAIEAGLDLVRGKGVISIERQVRIAAGLLGLSGTLAGVLIHPGFLCIPGFIGAGLAFAGITDTCGMGILLSKCPWNR